MWVRVTFESQFRPISSAVAILEVEKKAAKQAALQDIKLADARLIARSNKEKTRKVVEHSNKRPGRT